MQNKLYCTVMFPYPSGAGLHIGHWYNYSIVDSYCKIFRYLGYEIYQPFGYDSFGLPAENYARLVGGDPKTITETNIEKFSCEMRRMNTSFEYRLSTHLIEYQKRTQWLFSKLMEHGLAYKAFREQDYCPSCATVLAKEQVKDKTSGLVCDRCDTVTYKVNLNQWFFKITDYKQRLINDLDKVDYPEKTKKQQLQWLENLTDWCVSRQRKWGCPIPIDGETDTLDTFVDSSFYTIEYDKTRPVDVYVGGNEHACMHLIYARFICKFLFDIGYVDFDEPFKKVIHQGMILGPDGFKMSKSRGNVVDIENQDPQILRMSLMFINHYFDGGKWNDGSYNGCLKFRNKVYVWCDRYIEDSYSDISTVWFNFKNRVIQYFKEWKVNKVVSEWMIFYNTYKNDSLSPHQAAEIKDFFNTCF